MIKLNIMYPYSDTARFDHDYYRDRHMPLVASRLGSACHHYDVDKGLAGSRAGKPPPYLASCSIFSESLAELERALATHGAEVMADLVNYTDTRPVSWFSEVVDVRKQVE